MEVVQLLLKWDTDVNAAPDEWDGRTPLQAASEGGPLEVVQLLLEQNADVNAAPAEWDGRTALQAASGRDHLEVVRLLLERSLKSTLYQVSGMAERRYRRHQKSVTWRWSGCYSHETPTPIPDRLRNMVGRSCKRLQEKAMRK